jgi:hypothetical protein
MISRSQVRLSDEELSSGPFHGGNLLARSDAP